MILDLYNKNLFPKFFAEANNRLAKDGKLVILFSNLGQITKASKEHPIEKELAKGVRFQLEKCLKKSVKVASEKTKRDNQIRVLTMPKQQVMEQQPHN